MEEKVFDKIWFEKHQKKLLWLANSWIGKYIFQFKKMGHKLSSPIVKITPNSVAELVSIKDREVGEVELKEHFFNRNEYARKLYFYLSPVWYLMHFWDWILADKLAPQLSFGFSTLTVNPGNPPGDAVVLGYGPTDNWATIRSEAGAGGNLTPTTDITFTGWTEGASNLWKNLYRSIFCFDTSALTSGATISAVVFSLYGDSKTNEQGAVPSTNVFLATPADTSSLAYTDYSQIGTTAQCDTAITYANFALYSYNDWTLNATGRGNVSKTGISSFGCRDVTYDISGTAPANGGANLNSNVKGTYSRNASNKPQLVVTYSVIVGPANLKSYNTNLSANIKSINTNLIANVKSLNTNV